MELVNRRRLLAAQAFEQESLMHMEALQKKIALKRSETTHSAPMIGCGAPLLAECASCVMRPDELLTRSCAAYVAPPMRL